MFLLAAHPGEGRFTHPTAATQAWPRELVFMPQTGHPSCRKLSRIVPGVGMLFSWMRGSTNTVLQNL
jgi:hypothetical protein